MDQPITISALKYDGFYYVSPKDKIYFTDYLVEQLELIVRVVHSKKVVPAIKVVKDKTTPENVSKISEYDDELAYKGSKRTHTVYPVDISSEWVNECISNYDAFVKSISKSVELRGTAPESVTDDLVFNRKNNEAVLFLHEGNYADTIKLLSECTGLNSTGVCTSWYNLACAYALSGDSVRAISNLKIAVDKGFHDWRNILADTDFTTVLDEPEFVAIIKNLVDDTIADSARIKNTYEKTWGGSSAMNSPQAFWDPPSSLFDAKFCDYLNKHNIFMEKGFKSDPEFDAIFGAGQNSKDRTDPDVLMKLLKQRRLNRIERIEIEKSTKELVEYYEEKQEKLRTELVEYEENQKKLRKKKRNDSIISLRIIFKSLRKNTDLSSSELTAKLTEMSKRHGFESYEEVDNAILNEIKETITI